jgi:hypothetical protein
MKRDCRDESCDSSKCPPMLTGWRCPQVKEESLNPTMAQRHEQILSLHVVYTIHSGTAAKFARRSFNSMVCDEPRLAEFERFGVWATIS